MAGERLVPTGTALSAVPTLGRNQEKRMETPMRTATTISLEQETNPWEAQAARFEEAARRL